MRFGILAGPELVGQIIPLMQMSSLPCWVPVKRGGAQRWAQLLPVSAKSHSSHLDEACSRTTPPSSSACLGCASPDRPGPQSLGPCLLLQCLILSVPALCCYRSSEDQRDSSGPGHSTCRHTGACVWRDPFV